MAKKIYTDTDEFTIWQIDQDINGDSRYVVHYLTIPTPYDDDETSSADEFRAKQLAQFEHAKRALNGKRYRAKWFGGGIVFQAYAGNPEQHVRAAIAGMSQGDYYKRANAMLMHPSGSAL